MGNRAGLVLGVAVGVLVLLAVVAGVVSANRPGPQLPEGSPEAVVQEYLTAVVAGDEEEAAALLDPEGTCSAEDLEDAGERTTARVVLRDSEIDGDEAEVGVDFVYGSDGPFGGSEWRDEHTFDLRREGDSWVVTGEPWPVFSCRGDKP